MWTASQPGVLCHPVEIRRQSRNGGELETAVACVEFRRCMKRKQRATWLPKIKVKGGGQECPLYTTLGVTALSNATCSWQAGAPAPHTTLGRWVLGDSF
jgi:hypothetical protein